MLDMYVGRRPIVGLTLGGGGRCNVMSVLFVPDMHDLSSLYVLNDPLILYHVCLCYRFVPILTSHCNQVQTGSHEDQNETKIYRSEQT